MLRVALLHARPSTSSRNGLASPPIPAQVLTQTTSSLHRRLPATTAGTAVRPLQTEGRKAPVTLETRDLLFPSFTAGPRWTPERGSVPSFSAWRTGAPRDPKGRSEKGNHTVGFRSHRVYSIQRQGYYRQISKEWGLLFTNKPKSGIILLRS